MTEINFDKLQYLLMREDDIPNCIDLIEGAYIKNVAKKNSFESNDKNQPPWSWFGEELVHFHVLEYNLNTIGYVVWRKKSHISHLHSFLVSAEYQRLGIGTELLRMYEKGATKINSDCRLLTLHTYGETGYNHKFYFNKGYIRYKNKDEINVIDLKLWINNCEENNDWPLKENKILFYKQALAE